MSSLISVSIGAHLLTSNLNHSLPLMTNTMLHLILFKVFSLEIPIKYISVLYQKRLQVVKKEVMLTKLKIQKHPKKKILLLVLKKKIPMQVLSQEILQNLIVYN